jgi:thioredoxin reductase
MAIDTPARIAVIGAGPIGVEAALYARYLGYDVDIYERHTVGEHMRRWGHVRLFTPWSANVTPLGLAALQAQDEAWQPPQLDEHPTCGELVERYVSPLAHSDLIEDGLHEQTEVVAVGRPNLLKRELPGEVARGDELFRLLLRSSDGTERTAEADVVIDAGGVLGTPNALGQGGILAPGERDGRESIDYGLPDVLGRDRAKFAGRRVLVVGAGMSAAATLVALAQLEPKPQVTWVTRREPSAVRGAIDTIENDPLPLRLQLAHAANDLPGSGAVRHYPGCSIDRIARSPSGSVLVKLTGLDTRELEVDRMIACVGHRPNVSLFAELQVQLDPCTDAPPSLITTEPNFYVLGAKRWGRSPAFTLADGHRDIRDLFAIIGDRATLDLYATARPNMV